MASSIHIERNTLPKYAMPFAIIANSSVFETESKKYPMLTMDTQTNRRNSHGSFLRTNAVYPISKAVAITAIIAYVIIKAAPPLSKFMILQILYYIDREKSIKF